MPVAEQAARELEHRWLPAGAHGATSLVGVAVVDAEALLMAATPEMEDMYGWALADLIGTSMVDMVHPDDLATGAEAFGRTSAFLFSCPQPLDEVSLTPPRIGGEPPR